jgi:hypothetical protein
LSALNTRLSVAISSGLSKCAVNNGSPNASFIAFNDLDLSPSQARQPLPSQKRQFTYLIINYSSSKNPRATNSASRWAIVIRHNIPTIALPNIPLVR